MKDFLSSRMYHILCGIFDLVLVNLCFLLCCIPVVTIGAATSALYAAVYGMYREEGAVLRDFFRNFRHCIKSGICMWLLWLLAMGIAGMDFYIIGLYWDIPGKYVLLGVLALVLLVLLLWGSALFPILSGYTEWKHALLDAFRLSFRFLPRMLPVSMVHLLPLLIFLFWPYGFLLLLAFMILIWFSLSAYVNVMIMRPVLERAGNRERV